MSLVGTLSKTDQEERGSVRALPFTHSHASCPPCACLRWAQVIDAFDVGAAQQSSGCCVTPSRSRRTCAAGPAPG